MSARERRNLFLQLFIIPAVVLILIYLYYPILNTLYLSLFDINNFNLDKKAFIGFNNYIKLIHDPIFWLSFRNTVFMTAATLFIQLPIAFLLADALANHLKKNHPHLESWLFIAFFFPVILPTPVLAKTWRLFFTGLMGNGYGPFQWLTTTLGLTDTITQLLGTKTVLLLGEVNTAIWVVIGVQTWARIGFNLVIYRSAILAISHEIYESAEMDGAGPWRKLFSITYPLSKNVINMTIILAILGVFQLFDMVWMMTASGGNGGGPLNTTQLLATYMYSRAFIDLRTGYGAAIAMAIFLSALVLSVIENRFFHEAK